MGLPMPIRKLFLALAIRSNAEVNPPRQTLFPEQLDSGNVLAVY